MTTQYLPACVLRLSHTITFVVISSLHFNYGQMDVDVYTSFSQPD